LAITTLNSHEFAKELAQQAFSYAPGDLSEEQRTFVAKKVFDFSIIAGNHLIERYNKQFNDEQARVIVQFIGEWTFHKSIDMIRANIPQPHWDEILQQVAFSALQTAIQAFAEGQEQVKVAVTIELKVSAAYEACVKKLASEGVIPQDKVDEIISFSNVDKMAEESGGNVVKDEDKFLKYAALALVMKSLPQEKIESLLANFSEEDQQQIISLMQIDDIEQKVNPDLVAHYLQEIKKNVSFITKPKLTNSINAIKSLKKSFAEEDIFDIVGFERAKVIEFVEKSLFENVSKAAKTNFSPYIAKVLCSHIKSKLTAQI